MIHFKHPSDNKIPILNYDSPVCRGRKYIEMKSQESVEIRGKVPVGDNSERGVRILGGPPNFHFWCVPISSPQRGKHAAVCRTAYGARCLGPDGGPQELRDTPDSRGREGRNLSPTPPRTQFCQQIV